LVIENLQMAIDRGSFANDQFNDQLSIKSSGFSGTVQALALV
jgi:hypothetical protein